MRDSEFKALSHPTGANTIASKGSAVSKGYKPDVTVQCPDGKLLHIIESEQKTDRKAFLGDVLKAEMYAEQIGARPSLLIVMQVFANTTTKQIAEHLVPYVNWLSHLKGGALNLSSIQVLSDGEYVEAIAANEVIGSIKFMQRGHMLSTSKTACDSLGRALTSSTESAARKCKAAAI